MSDRQTISHPADPLIKNSTADPGDQAATVSSTDATAATAPLPATGRYELHTEIARGGMGVIHRATDTVFGREVAVKVLQERFALASWAAKRFFEEARITGQLQHPAIPPVHDVGTLPDGRPFLAMKLIKGDTLDLLLKRRFDPTVERGRFLAIFEQVSQAVAFAHDRKVIHRDLKPANVMVGNYGEVQVMDWGLAKVLTVGPEQKTVRSSDETLGTVIHSLRDSDEAFTQAGSMLGTPAFMPPEQAAGEIEKIDERADVFGLGAVLAVILTGQPPYVGKDSEAVRVMAIRGELGAVVSRLDSCGAEPGLVALCKRCLSFAASDRPRDAGEVAWAVAQLRAEAEERARRAELDRVRIEGEQAAAEGRAAEQRKRRKVQLALAVAVGLIAVGGGAFAWWQDNQAGEQRAADLRRQFEDEQRAANEQGKQTRNVERIEALLNQCEAALVEDDASKVAIPLIEAEQRAAESGGGHLADRLARCRTDFDMLRKLDRIDTLRWSLRPEFTAECSQAFAQFGIVPGTTSPEEVAQRVKGSFLQNRLLTTLDLWSWGAKSESLVAILRAIDPDPYRDAIRIAAAAGDNDRLKELTGQPAALQQPTSFAAVMGQMNGVPVAQRERLLLAALARRPDDFNVLLALSTIGMDKLMKDFKVGTKDFKLPDFRLLEQEKWCRAALAVRPDSAMAHMLLGSALFLEKKDADGAIAELEKAILLDPKTAIFHTMLATFRLAKGDRNGALAAHREAVRLDPENVDSHKTLALSQWAMGDLDGAIASYREVVRLQPKIASNHTSLGNVLREKKNFHGAIAAYSEAIRLDPKLAQVRLDQANMLYAIGDRDRAAVEYREAFRLNPKLVSIPNDRGLALLRQGDPDGAIAAFEEALRLDPTFAPGHINVGVALKRKGDLDGAIAAYKEAIKHNPMSALAHSNLGLALREKGDLDGAVAAFKEAIHLDPKYVLAHNSLGYALSVKGDLDGTIAVFREAIRIDSKNVYAHHRLGLALRSKGDLDGAVAAFQEVLRLDPKHLHAKGDLDFVERWRVLLLRVPDIAAGRTEPKTQLETLELAELCAQPFQKRYVLAVRLFAGTFPANAKVADDVLVRHRYNAACCAALAAAGKDPELTTVGVDEWGYLTDRALEWLRAERAAWSARSKDTRQWPLVRANMIHWKKDADLAVVRDPAWLAAMPELDRKCWEQLWTDVDTLLASVSPIAPPPRPVSPP